MECVKDCMPGGPLDNNGDCGGIAEPWYPLFLTAKVCCMTKLSWLDPDECEANTRGATFHTNKFYVGELKMHDILRKLRCMSLHYRLTSDLLSLFDYAQPAQCATSL